VKAENEEQEADDESLLNSNANGVEAEAEFNVGSTIII